MKLTVHRLWSGSWPSSTANGTRRTAADPRLLRHLRHGNVPAWPKRSWRTPPMFPRVGESVRVSRGFRQACCRTTWRATSRAWCTPASATPGCATAAGDGVHRVHRPPAPRTWSPAPRWPPSTGSRCCCCPATSSPPGWPTRCLQELEDPRGYDVSVNDAFRPVSRFFDRVTGRSSCRRRCWARCGCSPIPPQQAQ